MESAAEHRKIILVLLAGIAIAIVLGVGTFFFKKAQPVVPETPFRELTREEEILQALSQPAVLPPSKEQVEQMRKEAQEALSMPAQEKENVSQRDRGTIQEALEVPINK